MGPDQPGGQKGEDFFLFKKKNIVKVFSLDFGPPKISGPGGPCGNPGLDSIMY